MGDAVVERGGRRKERGKKKLGDAVGSVGDAVDNAVEK